jgi:hypothetical protein
MSDSTSTVTVKLLSSGDLAALTRGKEQADALKLSADVLRSSLELLAVPMSFGAAFETAKSMVEYGASIEHLSEQAGISAQAFQQLSYAAIGAGLHQEDLSTALNVLQRNMAQAADGATKQNRAIADLGLNTAELLAMPVEQQIKAIAVAYEDSSDKAKAWADVTALLGKNSARFKGVLEEIAKDGPAAVDAIMISDADLERLEKTERFWAKVWMNVKAVSAQAVARPGDALLMLLNGAPGGVSSAAAFAAFEAKGASGEKPKAKQSASEIAADLERSEQMTTAHDALTKALANEGRAYETAAQSAKRLWAEADAAQLKAAQLASDKGNPIAQLESVRLRTEAAKLRTQANQEDARAAKEKAQYAAQEAELSQRNAQDALKLTPLYSQLVQAKQHQVDLEQRLSALNPQSLTYQQDHLKIGEELRTVKGQILALTEKEYAEMLAAFEKEDEMNTKRAAVAIVAIEHDATLTDTQKWVAKQKVWEGLVAAQQAYITNMKVIEGDPSAPASIRIKAGNDAEKGANDVASTMNAKAAAGPDPHSFAQNWSADIKNLRGQWDHLQSDMARSLTGVISSGLSTVSNQLTRLITGAQSLGQAFRNIAVDIGTTLVQAFVDMGVKWVANRIMMAVAGETIAASETAASAAMAAAQLAVWGPVAMAMSIATFGAADIAGIAGFTGAMAASKVVSLASASDGGYFPGDPTKPRGIFHGDEYVWSAPAVRAVGADNLERAHQAALRGGVSAPSVSGGGASGGGGNSTTHVIALSPEDVARSLRQHMDARVVRTVGRIPTARVKM